MLASWRYGGVGARALPLGSMISKHNSEANEDKDMNLQKIPVYKKMKADYMVHIIPNKCSYVMYKKSECEKIFGKFGLRTRAGESN